MKKTYLETIKDLSDAEIQALNEREQLIGSQTEQAFDDYQDSLLLRLQCE